MRRLSTLFTALIIAVFFTLSGSLMAYDASQAEGFAQMFAPMKGAAVAKKLNLIPPDKLMEVIKQHKSLTVVDIRTPAETAVLGINLPGTLNIPLNVLFQKSSLDSIPTDHMVVVICQSGIRATAAVTSLRAIGFDKVYILKGGMKNLISYLGPKEANMPLKKVDQK